MAALRVGPHAKAVYRTSRMYDTVAVVYVAAEAAARAEQFHDPSVRLRVSPDGAWSVAHRPGRWDATETVIAAGHVDGPDRADDPCVSLSQLAAFLDRETSVLDPEDVPALVAALRSHLAEQHQAAAAAGPPTEG